MNANCGGREHVAIHVEQQVISWCRTIMGFPAGSSGLLVSGTSMATIVALKAARDHALGFSASRKGGVANAQQLLPGGGALVGYAAEGTHSCVKRALDVLGLGSDALRMVPVAADFTMDLEALRGMIADDRAAARRPFLIVGTAGSVNVGAVDDLGGLADLAEGEGLWLHVDGAFGAPAVLSAEARPLLRGLERAASVAFDFHKWLHVNYDAGCVLLREQHAHLGAFSERPDYLAPKTRGIAAGGWWPCDYGLELSRSFRALKVYSHFLEHGTAKLGAAISANLAHARHLAALIDASPCLERLAPVALQIVNCRYVPPGRALDATALDALNDEIVLVLHESGVAAPSTTRIRGRLSIRVSVTNHRTRFEDMDLLAAEIVRIGHELVRAQDAAAAGSAAPAA